MPKYIVTKAPAPLDWARVSQPLMGTPRAIGITSKAPHPAAARAFVDYWLSDKSMEILAKDVGEYVLAPGVFPPIDGIDKAKVIAIRELSDDEIAEVGRRVQEDLRREEVAAARVTTAARGIARRPAALQGQPGQHHGNPHPGRQQVLLLRGQDHQGPG